MTFASRAQGVHGSGSRDYSSADANRVVSALLGAERPLTVEDIESLTRVGGRAVRQIVSDFDGIDFLIGGGDEGMRVCAWADEGDGFTRRLDSQARKMAERVERRQRFARSRLPRRQEGLF